MRAVVMVESLWGNTRRVAHAVAEGRAADWGADDAATSVEVADEREAPPVADLAGPGVDLLLVSAPTHAFGLSRQRTRGDAGRGASAQDAVCGLRACLAECGSPPDTAPGLRLGQLSFAAFDTHVNHPNLPGWSRHGADKRLRAVGCHRLALPESFSVEGYDGPLLPGELDRARGGGAAVAPAAAGARA